MRPASRRALLERLAATAPQRSPWMWSALALIVLGTIVLAHFLGGTEQAQLPVASKERGAPLLEGVLALPFGEGNASAPASTPGDDGGRIDELRDAFRRADDLRTLYIQWRERPEADARYLAFRAARICELMRAGGLTAEVDAFSERRGEHERQIVFAATRCRGFLITPVAPEEVRRLAQDAAAAGSAAAQVALAADTAAGRPVSETVAVLRRALASGDPLAFDEARVLLAMSRHQVEIAGIPPAGGDWRSIDARVVAIDLASCRLGNPCGSGRGSIAIDCGPDQLCQRDAEEWVMQIAGLDDQERRAARTLADKMFAAFKRGAVDEIVRMPVAAPSRH